MKIRSAATACLVTLGVLVTGLVAQEEKPAPEMLTIGSVAPVLDVEHWVQDGNGKFAAVTKFEDGKVYLVEFWATWCGPCIRSMPHIVEMQENFGDRGFQVVSISDEDLETVEGFLEREVPGKDDMTYKELTSAYCLTTDPDGSAEKDYMRAAGQNGIPTAFLVGKTGNIEWIGHPMDNLDKVIEQVLDGDWDRKAFAATFQAKQEMQVMQAKLGRLLQQDKTEEALNLLDETIDNMAKKNSDDSIMEPMRRMRSQLLIMTGSKGAAEAMTKMTAEMDNPQVLNQMAWTVVQLKDSGKDVSPALIAAAYAAAQKGIKLAPDGAPLIDTAAHLVYLQGNLDEAIKLAELAVLKGGDDYPEIGEFLKKLKKEKAGDKDD